MEGVYLKNQLKGYPIEVISNVLDVINVLGENYGANRDIEKDLGGYNYSQKISLLSKC